MTHQEAHASVIGGGAAQSDQREVSTSSMKETQNDEPKPRNVGAQESRERQLSDHSQLTAARVDYVR